jgi:hypothetical protein
MPKIHHPVFLPSLSRIGYVQFVKLSKIVDLNMLKIVKITNAKIAVFLCVFETE